MKQVTTDQAIQLALQHHQAGRLSEAEGIYREVLAQQPNHPDALHYLGVVAHQVGRHDAAVELIRQAIAVNPNDPEAHNNLAVALKDQRKFEEAAAACGRAIELHPGFVAAYCNLGTALIGLGKFDESLAASLRAIQLQPDCSDAYNNIGDALDGQGKFQEAVDAYGKAIQIKPDFAAAYSNLGVTLSHQGKLDEAIAAFRAAIRLKPDLANAWGNLGLTLNSRHKFDEAASVLRRAVQLKLDDSVAFGNLGIALRKQGKLEEAVAAYRQALRLKPNSAEVYRNMSVAMADQGAYRDAVDACRTAIQLRPDFAEAHFNLACLLLLLGDLSHGWREFEWRWKRKDVVSRAPQFLQPRWTGEKLNGQTVLLYSEQGFGDTIQFVRYASSVAAMGGKVILICQPELHRLLKPMPGLLHVARSGEHVPAFDLHCPLLSLPLAFATTLDSIPHSIPYLYADPGLRDVWANTLRAEPKHLRVGLAWAGSSEHKNDLSRSIELKLMMPLAAVENVQFYSLQTGPPASQAMDPVAGLEVMDFSALLKDFAETAALIANLDLVITVDTAVAHLAGAMGKPVWLLLAFSPDWRWMLDRDDSSWYPTIRLFRQKSIGNWKEVIERVAEQLARFAETAVMSAEVKR